MKNNIIIALLIAAGSDLVVPAGAIIVAGIGAWGVWKGLKRTKSGKIDTTEAADLWKEATAMRSELRDEVQALQSEIKALKEDEAALKAENQTLRQENERWRARVETLETGMTELRSRNDSLNTRVTELERSRG